MPSAKQIDPELRKAIDGSTQAYAASDRSFFGYLTENVRVYSVNSAAPTTTAREFERSFGEAFKRRRKVNVVSEDIDARADRAVLSLTSEVTSEDVTTYVRQTVIWDLGKAGWKISHIHNAIVGQPVFVGRAPRDLAGIRVMNEHIATVAAAVGVAQ